MKHRHKMHKKKSKKLFSRTGDRTHKFNLQSSAAKYMMRGGVRM